MGDDPVVSPEEELAALRAETKKLRRELKHITKDNEVLRMANEQAARTQEFIQRDNLRQIFFNRQLLKSSPYVLVLTDDKLQTVMVSDEFFRYSEVDSKQIGAGIYLKNAFEGWFDDEQLDIFIKSCERVLAGKEVEPYIIRTTIRQKTMDLQLTISPMPGDDDKPIGLNIIFVDMTEMIDAREKADQANRAKSSFLANMSHEIRTPINAVLGMDEMILRESGEKDIISYAEDIKTAGKTLLALINEILDFSKVEEGKMEIIPTRYELGSLINDLINMIRDRVEKKGLELKLDIDEDIPHELYGDEIRIKQCILNLLNNAVKYTEKGSVKLGVSFFKKDINHIFLEIHVSDTGIGMKQEDMDRLFAPFVRIEEKRNRAIEGTGLGMSITKRLLELMGTSLSVDSVYGKGSDFSFSIEQKILNPERLGSFAEKFDKGNRTPSTRAHAPVFQAPDARILAVDDTETNLLVIKRLLKETNVQIDTVASGYDALEKCESVNYDVIFVDHMMPGMDGLETLARLKKLESDTKPVYIALTANAISGSRERYMEAGFDDYLSKPVDGDVLESMLKRYIPKEKLVSDEDSEADAPALPKDDTEIPLWLYDVPGLEIDEGIKNCGGKDSFMDVITTFHDTSDQKYREIVGFFTEKDWKNYTIRVHALKSSARIIGAIRLSKLAEALEEAGDKADIDYIEKHTDACLGMFDMLNARLSKFDEVDKELPLIDDSMRDEAYEAIYEFSGNMDFGTVESVLNSLKEYRLKPDDEVIIRSVHDCLMRLDWDGIVELVKGRIAK